MKAVLIRFSCIVLMLWGLLWVFYQQGYRIITTPSVPEGIWKVEPVRAPIRRGQFVWLCPPDTKIFRLAKNRGYTPDGDCPGGYMHLIKPVAAVEGDRLEMSRLGVRVNGKSILNSVPMEKDSNGRWMPIYKLGTYQVPHGVIWFISPYHAQSFDSRYFGPLETLRAEGLAIPIWINRLQGSGCC